MDAVVSLLDGRLSRLDNIDGQGTLARNDDINSQLIWLSDVRSGDLDGDGDLDAVLTDLVADKLDWFENVNGDGSRMQQHNIAYQFNSASTVDIADVDDDGDLDLIAVGDVSLFWFENTDGRGNFGDKILIAEQLGSDYLSLIHI